MNELLNLDLTNISYGALFIWLLIDTNKKNQSREEKYQSTIDKLAEKVGKIDSVADDVDEVKTMLKEVIINE